MRGPTAQDTGGVQTRRKPGGEVEIDPTDMFGTKGKNRDREPTNSNTAPSDFISDFSANQSVYSKKQEEDDCPKRRFIGSGIINDPKSSSREFAPGSSHRESRIDHSKMVRRSPIRIPSPTNARRHPLFSSASFDGNADVFDARGAAETHHSDDQPIGETPIRADEGGPSFSPTGRLQSTLQQG